MRHLLLGGVLLVYAVLLTNYSDSLGVFEDDGMNLNTARLIGEGHSLYESIYYDHPPALPHLLGLWTTHISDDYRSVQILPILLSVILCLCLFAMVRSCISPVAAWGALATMLSSCFFFKFSYAIIHSLHMLAALTVAIWLVMRPAPKWWHVVLSAAVFAFAVLIKFSAIPYGLVILVSLFTTHRQQRPWPVMLLWCGLVLLILATVFSQWSLPLLKTCLLDPHWVAETDPFQKSALRRAWLFRLPGTLWFLGAVAGSLIAMTLSRQERCRPFLVWTLIAMAICLFHNPLWPYYFLHLLIPGAICIGMFLNLWSVRTGITRRNVRILRRGGMGLVTVLILGAWILPWRHLHPYQYFFDGDLYQARMEVAKKVRTMTRDGAWIWTDAPLLGYLTGRSLPPELAMAPGKRIRCGDLDDETLMRHLQIYEPEVIVLGSTMFVSYEGLQAILTCDYELTGRYDFRRTWRREHTLYLVFRRRSDWGSAP